MTSIFKQPLVHFLIGALLVFLFFKLVGSDQAAPDDTIVINQAQIDRLIGRWQGTWRRVPTDQERQGLIEDMLRDEVLYREGLRLGLDENDAVVRNRMIQKMRFLQDGALTDPSEADLQAWLDKDSAKYQKSDLYTFEHKFFGQKTDQKIVESQLQALTEGSNYEDVSKPLFNLPESMNRASKGMITQQFGDEFTTQVSELEAGKWHGPITSGFGVHLVQVSNIEKAPSPGLDQPGVRQQVENDWRAAQRKLEQARQNAILRQRYQITIAD